MRLLALLIPLGRRVHALLLRLHHNSRRRCTRMRRLTLSFVSVDAVSAFSLPIFPWDFRSVHTPLASTTRATKSTTVVAGRLIFQARRESHGRLFPLHPPAPFVKLSLFFPFGSFKIFALPNVRKFAALFGFLDEVRIPDVVSVFSNGSTFRRQNTSFSRKFDVGRKFEFSRIGNTVENFGIGITTIAKRLYLKVTLSFANEKNL